MTPPADVNHTFSDAELEELIPFGAVESHKAGDLILAEGTMAPDCIITLSGHTDIFATTDQGRRRVGWMERGQFAGDLSVLPYLVMEYVHGRTLQHWILFYVQDGETRKSVLRQHQRRAIDAILDRCADPAKTRG